MGAMVAFRYTILLGHYVNMIGMQVSQCDCTKKERCITDTLYFKQWKKNISRGTNIYDHEM